MSDRCNIADRWCDMCYKCNEYAMEGKCPDCDALAALTVAGDGLADAEMLPSIDRTAFTCRLCRSVFPHEVHKPDCPVAAWEKAKGE